MQKYFDGYSDLVEHSWKYITEQTSRYFIDLVELVKDDPKLSVKYPKKRYKMENGFYDDTKILYHMYLSDISNEDKVIMLNRVLKRLPCIDHYCSKESLTNTNDEDILGTLENNYTYIESNFELFHPVPFDYVEILHKNVEIQGVDEGEIKLLNPFYRLDNLNTLHLHLSDCMYEANIRCIVSKESCFYIPIFMLNDYIKAKTH